MKKFILTLAAFIISTGCCFAQKYRGFVDLSYSYVLPKGDNQRNLVFYERNWLGFSTSHGVQLKKLFVGAGLEIGTEMSGGCTLPVYADIRYDFFRRSSTNFFVDCKLGGYVYSPDSYDTRIGNSYKNECDGKITWFYFKPAIGMRFRLSSVVGINLALFYTPMNVSCKKVERQSIVNGEEWIGWTYTSTPDRSFIAHRVGLSLGIDF